MIVDITGIILIPGNGGQDCPGNGDHPGIECACDECDYLMCCFWGREDCRKCTDANCQRKELHR